MVLSQHYVVPPLGLVCMSEHSICTYLGLQIDLGVPVGIVQNDNICTGQVDAKTPCSGGQHKDKLFAARFVVLINEFLGKGREENYSVILTSKKLQ